MFSVRNATRPLSNDEIRRQRIAQQIIFGDRMPITLFEKKIAAIVHHKSIDVVLSLKVLKSLDAVLKLFNNESDLYETETKNNILAFLQTVQIEDGDVFKLPVKLPIYAYNQEQQQQQCNEKKRVDFNFQLEAISDVNLLEFEYLCFKNKTLFKYYADTSFAAYLYQNLLYSLNVYDMNQLLEDYHLSKNMYNNDDNSTLTYNYDVNDVSLSSNWRKRLLILLYVTNVNESVAYNAFYQNTVIYKNKEYDTSFVPKYDVKKLIPVTEIVATSTEQYMIDYYYSINISTMHEIPEQNIGIFLTFPFKDGYYVYPNGTVMYANVPRLRKRSVITTISSICDVSDLEAAIDSVARRISKEDALSYAAYAKNLIQQGIALMVLRRIICGDSVRVPSLNTNVRLPNEYDILSWTRMSCYRRSGKRNNNGNLSLPVNFKSPTGDRSTSLVRDIAKASCTKIDAAILCSRYRIPEIDVYYVFSNLKLDSELYVFYTILLQEYCNFMYYAARNALNPTFGNDTSIDVASLYEASARKFVDTDVNKRLDSVTKPSISYEPWYNCQQIDCSPYKCPTVYEFSNSQLREMVSQEDTRLNDQQLASFIVLCVQ